MYRQMNESAWVGFNAYLDARLRTQTPRRRQLNESILLHAQHGHPAGHVFQAPIRFEPVYGLTDPTRKFRTGTTGVLRDERPHQVQFFFAEIATTVTFQEVSGEGVGLFGACFRGCFNSQRRASSIAQGIKGVKSVGGLPPFSAHAVR